MTTTMTVKMNPVAPTARVAATKQPKQTAVGLPTLARTAAMTRKNDTMNENYKEYQRDMADEAKQAAKESAKELGRFTNKTVAGGVEHYDTITGEKWFESDCCPSDEGCDNEDCGDDEEENDE
jgi:hypothetical protein